MSRPRAKKQRKQLGRNGTAVLVAFALLCVAAVGYFVVVRPKHAEAKQLDARLAEVEAEIAAHPTAESTPAAPKVVVADLFRMAKAMPDNSDVPGLLLELNRVAKESGIVFESLSPRPAEPREGYSVVPISVALSGDFYTLSDFLFRLRNLVQVRDGALTATGRLFSVDSITFTPVDAGLSASLAITAFVYGAAPAAPAPAPPPAPAPDPNATETTDTGATTPPPADPNQPPEAPATAAPAAGGTS